MRINRGHRHIKATFRNDAGRKLEPRAMVGVSKVDDTLGPGIQQSHSGIGKIDSIGRASDLVVDDATA